MYNWPIGFHVENHMFTVIAPFAPNFCSQIFYKHSFALTSLMSDFLLLLETFLLHMFLSSSQMILSQKCVCDDVDGNDSVAFAVNEITKKKRHKFNLCKQNIAMTCIYQIYSYKM